MNLLRTDVPGHLPSNLLPSAVPRMQFSNSGHLWVYCILVKRRRSEIVYKAAWVCRDWWTYFRGNLSGGTVALSACVESCWHANLACNPPQSTYCLPCASTIKSLSDIFICISTITQFSVKHFNENCSWHHSEQSFLKFYSPNCQIIKIWSRFQGGVETWSIWTQCGLSAASQVQV